MSLIKFQDWMIAKESSPATRSKKAAALGLGPDFASVYGHSTPAPWIAKRLEKNLKKKSSKSNLPGDDPPAPIWTIPEKAQQPDYSFDTWLQDVVKKSGELADAKKSADEENERLDKEITDRLKEKEKQDEADKKSDKKSQSSQKKNKEEDKEGKETRWTGQSKEVQDKEKSGIGSNDSHVGQKGS